MRKLRAQAESSKKRRAQIERNIRSIDRKMGILNERYLALKALIDKAPTPANHNRYVNPINRIVDQLEAQERLRDKQSTQMSLVPDHEGREAAHDPRPRRFGEDGSASCTTEHPLIRRAAIVAFRSPVESSRLGPLGYEAVATGGGTALSGEPEESNPAAPPRRRTRRTCGPAATPGGARILTSSMSRSFAFTPWG